MKNIPGTQINADGNAYLIQVSHTLAFSWLKTSPGNRKTRDGIVTRYSNDMVAGKWHAGNDAIIFDQSNRLRNAHHRLQAVIISGKTVPFLVRGGVHDNEIPSMDQGLSRSSVDALCFGDPERFRGLVTTWKANTVKMMLCQSGTGKRSHEVIGEAIADYSEELDFVLNECFEGKRIQAPLSAAFVLAAADNKDHWENLKYAGNYLQDIGDSLLRSLESGERSRLKGTSWLIALHKYVYAVKRTGGGSVNRRDKFNVTCNVLHKFLSGDDGKKPSICKAIKESRTFFRMPPKPYLAAIESIPKTELVIFLCKAVEQYHDGQELTPLQIAEDMIRLGARSTAVRPEKAISQWFANVVKKIEEKLQVGQYGYFTAINPTNKRVKNYRWHSSNHQ